MEADGRVVRLSQALRSVKLRLDRLVRPDGISKGGREETRNRTREWLDLEWKSRSQLISRGDRVIPANISAPWKWNVLVELAEGRRRRKGGSVGKLVLSF